MKNLSARIALALLAVNVVGMVVAIVLDLGARLVIGEVQSGDLGIEVIWWGSAISAPPPPLVLLIAGLWLVTKTGRSRAIGFVLFILAGVMMTIGVIGEFVEGASFSGGKQVVFLLFSIAIGLLAAALAATSVRELADGRARRGTEEREAF